MRGCSGPPTLAGGRGSMLPPRPIPYPPPQQVPGVPLRDRRVPALPTGGAPLRLHSWASTPPAAGSRAAAIQRVLVIQDKLNIASAVNCRGHHPAGDLYLHLMWRIFFSFFFQCPCSCWQSHELWRHLITRSAARFLTLWVFVAVNKNTRFNKWVTFPVSARVLLVFSEGFDQYAINALGAV